MIFDDVCPQRVTAMQTAVELDVAKDEFPFNTADEADLWDELEREFAELVARLGRVWTADEAFSQPGP